MPRAHARPRDSTRYASATARDRATEADFKTRRSARNALGDRETIFSSVGKTVSFPRGRLNLTEIGNDRLNVGQRRFRLINKQERSMEWHLSSTRCFPSFREKLSQMRRESDRTCADDLRILSRVRGTKFPRRRGSWRSRAFPSAFLSAEEEGRNDARLAAVQRQQQIIARI